MISISFLCYGRLIAHLTDPVHDAWPTDGFHYAAAKYQLSMLSLSLALLSDRQGEEGPRSEAWLHETDRQRKALHEAYRALAASASALAPDFAQLEELRSTLGQLGQLEADLDRLVNDASADPRGLARLNKRISQAFQRVASSTAALRAKEQTAFDSAFSWQRRSAFRWQELGLVLLALLGLGMAGHFHVSLRERRTLAKEAEARAEAQRTAQARTALLGMVSHELRTPLQALMTNAELLAALASDDEVLDVSSRMIRVLEQMSGQLDNIARYARLTSGTEEIRREATQVPELLRSVAAVHAAEAARGRQSIELKVGEGTDLTIYTDPIRLVQIVDNYVVNALKYAGPGVITLSCAVVQAVSVDPHASIDAIEICVTDQGPGISDGEKDQIWDPFFRGGRGTRKKKGTGLGLAVVKLLASSVGWTFGTRSSPEAGTTFFVRVPLEQTSGRAGAFQKDIIRAQ